MECPLCGETLPLHSRVCLSCGHEFDTFFLTEEAQSSEVRRSVAPSKAPRQPAALKPSRPPISRKTMGLIGASVGAVAIIAVAIVLFTMSGSALPQKPEDTVAKYYEYLQKGDVTGLLNLFESGFQPTANDRVAVSAVLHANSYKVTGPNVHLISDADGTAYVAIDSIDVSTTPKNDGAPTQDSLAALIQKSRPGGQVAAVVKLVNSGDGWRISGRPFNGWGPANIWLIGQLQPV